MILNRKIVLPLAAVAVIAATGAGVATASATSSPSGGSLAQRLASTFGLDQSKVQSVIDQYRSDQSAQRESSYEARLSQAVTAGKITSAQQQAILTEHAKLQTELQAAMQKTGTDRRAALQAIRTEAQTWAKQNGVSAGWLLAPRRLRAGHGFGSGNTTSPMSPNPSASSSPSPSSSPAT
jgi:hypothetical protein